MKVGMKNIEEQMRRKQGKRDEGRLKEEGCMDGRKEKEASKRLQRNKEKRGWMNAKRVE